eukprot:3710542-Rhodomonas_salina.1
MSCWDMAGNCAPLLPGRIQHCKHSLPRDSSWKHASQSFQDIVAVWQCHTVRLHSHSKTQVNTPSNGCQ